MLVKNLALALILLAVGSSATGEILAWNAVTTYTDGTSTGVSPVMYRVFWSTGASLTSLMEIGTASKGTTRKFHVARESMPRGSTIYFTARAIVGGTESANTAPLSWTVPNKHPATPGNFRKQQGEEPK